MIGQWGKPDLRSLYLPRTVGCPISRCVFREMWDTANLNLIAHCSLEKLKGLALVASHISRKTSEMWGTQRSAGRNLEQSLENVRGYPHAQLYSSRGLGQGANGDVIHPGKSILADVLERDAARGFKFESQGRGCARWPPPSWSRPGSYCPTAATPHPPSAPDPAQSNSALRIDRLARRSCGKGAGQHLGNTAAQRDVIALDQNAVGKIEPMALAPAAADSVFIQHAQTGNGLARVQHLGFGAGDGIHILPGSRWRCRSCAASG